MQVEAGITLTLGGARSGKSEVAERLASVDGARVTYVATGTFSDPADLGAPVDEAWLARVDAHRARRPADWDTIEVPQGGDLARAVEAIAGLALVDSLGTWVAGLPGFGESGAGAVLLDEFVTTLDMRRRSGRPSVVVSEEVGLGVHPSTPLGGSFRDALGLLNRRVADVADRVLLVVAGRALALGPAVADVREPTPTPLEGPG